MTWVREPWEADGFNVIVPVDADGTMYPFRVLSPEMARLVAAAPELRDALTEVTNWLSGTEAFATSHGAHTAVVEAQKLLARVNGDD